MTLKDKVLARANHIPKDPLIAKAHDEAKALIRRGEYLYALAMTAKREDNEGMQAREELKCIYGADNV